MLEESALLLKTGLWCRWAEKRHYDFGCCKDLSVQIARRGVHHSTSIYHYAASSDQAEGDNLWKGFFYPTWKYDSSQFSIHIVPKGISVLAQLPANPTAQILTSNDQIFWKMAEQIHQLKCKQWVERSTGGHTLFQRIVLTGLEKLMSRRHKWISSNGTT